MPSSADLRLAVLFDAENIPVISVDGIFDELTTLGRAVVRRAYGDFGRLQTEAWSEACVRHDISERQCRGFARGKNAADLRLTIDAMDLIHGKTVDGFAVASSDTDFVPLAERLREERMPYFGFGNARAPERLRQASTRFYFVENLVPPGSPGIMKRQATPLLRPLDLVPLLRSAIVAFRDQDGWLSVETLQEKLLEYDRSFDARSYGFRQLADLLDRLRGFVVDGTAEGGPRVRLKNKKRRRAFVRQGVTSPGTG